MSTPTLTLEQLQNQVNQVAPPTEETRRAILRMQMEAGMTAAQAQEPQKSTADVLGVPKWTTATHEEINRATVEPEELGLDSFRSQVQTDSRMRKRLRIFFLFGIQIQQRTSVSIWAHLICASWILIATSFRLG